jgi:two-component system NarL family sensor kinase
LIKPNLVLRTCKTLIVIVFLLVPFLAEAQNVDMAKSMEAKLSAESNPAKKLVLYLDVIDAIGDYDSISTEKYMQEALRLADKLQDTKAKAELYRQQGLMYMTFNDVPKSLVCYNKALGFARIVKDKILIGDIYNSTSNAYMQAHDNKLTDEYILKALSEYQQAHSEPDIAVIYANIGSNYSRRGEYAKSIEFFLKSLAIRERLHNDKGVGSVAFNITIPYKTLKRYDEALKYNKLAIEKLTLVKNEGMLASAYAVKGSILRSLKNYDEALTYINKAVPLFQKYKNNNGIRNSYDNIGLIYVAKNDLTNALKYFLMSKQISVNLQDPAGIVSADVNIAQTALDLQNLKTVASTLKEAEPLAKKYNFKEDLAELYKVKVQYLIAVNDHKTATTTFNEYLNLKDSLSSSDVNQQISDMQTRYETEKKDSQIKLLNKEKSINLLELKNQALKLKQRNILIIAFCILLLAGTFAAYTNYNRYKTKQEARLQAEVHKQQEIETRSLFEGEQKERIRIARDLHDSIGQMLSVIKMNVSNIQHEQPDNKITGATLELVDNTIVEVRNISHNLIPEELNFGLFTALEDMCDKINQSNTTQVSINVPDEVREHQFEKTNELSIYRIVQEVLSNMVKHSQASQIAIDVLQQEKNLTIAIKDNGKGFDTAQINKSKGLGWKNIAARVNMLDGKMQVRSEQLTGTQIEITIPGA